MSLRSSVGSRRCPTYLTGMGSNLVDAQFHLLGFTFCGWVNCSRNVEVGQFVPKINKWIKNTRCLSKSPVLSNEKHDLAKIQLTSHSKKLR